VTFEPGQRVRIPDRSDLPGHVLIEMANQIRDGWVLFVKQSTGTFAKVELTAAQAQGCEVLTEDGAGDSVALLAGLWTAWMRAAGSGARSSVLASTPLRPYAHPMNAVYGAMLPQPRLRFLFADEPVPARRSRRGLYLREMQRLALVRWALIVVPAHLVTKWQADFERRPWTWSTGTSLAVAVPLGKMVYGKRAATSPDGPRGDPQTPPRRHGDGHAVRSRARKAFRRRSEVEQLTLIVRPACALPVLLLLLTYRTGFNDTASYGPGVRGGWRGGTAGAGPGSR